MRLLNRWPVLAAVALLLTACADPEPFAPEPDEGSTLTVGTFESISTGAFHTCGINTDQVLYCWGYNAFGQLGDGTHADRTTPVLVLGQ